MARSTGAQWPSASSSSFASTAVAGLESLEPRAADLQARRADRRSSSPSTGRPPACSPFPIRSKPPRPSHRPASRARAEADHAHRRQRAHRATLSQSHSASIDVEAGVAPRRQTRARPPAPRPGRDSRHGGGWHQRRACARRRRCRDRHGHGHGCCDRKRRHHAARRATCAGSPGRSSSAGL